MTSIQYITLGVSDPSSAEDFYAAAPVRASKKFHVDHGLTVGKSFGKYVEFAMPTSPVRLGLYSPEALAKDAGVSPDGTGSHRVVIAGDAVPFTDPAGFEWE